ncbi:MAG: enoyl-CoA hydratase/isomerase family protein [Deltaproteobacteria bacterium]|nr:enoyl-CoA hydratase/isomerase family protein [Deltaproteobacteria bacterium]MBW2017851.1 enoyl-CoA hydratase/isomerase family protein [Deltaproteobacteria bacterium]MBW2129467.1 enoyl-CoA hydratase/isomerase family protein [Deltaproteobacteria bacterium]MBW2302164.1 enoyl-CoA hydratase/isomerase family protein [Deltaproteobacteria bacterium]
MEKPLKLEMKENIAILTLNRPKAFNAFNHEVVEPLTRNLMSITKDPDVDGVVITGEGKAFCAGGDLKWLSKYEKSRSEPFHNLAALFHQGILEIRRMPKPVVAAINGFAAGGGFSLALACDFRVMETSATLLQGYTSNGLSIDGGGTFTLPRIVGLARAMEIVAFDRPIPAEKALSWGLITKVVEDGKSLEESLNLIREILKRPLSSFAASKRLLGESFQVPLEVELEREREALAWCAEHPNGIEGIQAFLEKRKPRYNAR